MSILQLFLFLIVGCAWSLPAAPTVMVWMCLERCFNTTASQVQEHIATLKAHADVVDAVSFEQFNLGPNSTLLDNPTLSSVALPLKAAGFSTFAMVSSFPYPPDFIFWLRELFANPGPFVAQCVAASAKFNLTGLNLDFEPASGVTPQDALDYAAFLTNFTAAMHAHDVLVTADIAGWSPLWNLTALDAAPVDRYFYMGTYARNMTTFLAQLDKATGAISADKLAVGLQNYVGNNITDMLSEQDATARFAAILNHSSVRSVGVWAMPLDANWFGAVSTWKKARFPAAAACASDADCHGTGQYCDAQTHACACAFGPLANGACTSVERLLSPVPLIGVSAAALACVACALVWCVTALRNKRQRTFDRL